MANESRLLFPPEDTEPAKQVVYKLIKQDWYHHATLLDDEAMHREVLSSDSWWR